MTAARLYLDEDVRPLLAEILSSRGYDVISAVQKRRQGLTDHQQLEFAIGEKRTFFSHNIRDFVKLHHSFSESHYGLIVSNQDSLNIILRRLLAFLSKETPDSIKGKLFWLSNYEPPQRLM